jgi:hypothetical protein
VEPESLASRRLSGSTADRHIAGAVSQTPFVLVPHRISELHSEVMTLSVQDFWLKSQFIAKMELAQDFF